MESPTIILGFSQYSFLANPCIINPVYIIYILYYTILIILYYISLLPNTTDLYLSFCVASPTDLYLSFCVLIQTFFSVMFFVYSRLGVHPCHVTALVTSSPKWCLLPPLTASWRRATLGIPSRCTTQSGPQALH